MNAKAAKHIIRDFYEKTNPSDEEAFAKATLGDLVVTGFEKKISCIQKKKAISYCQMFVNRGEFVDPVQLQNYLREEMA